MIRGKNDDEEWVKEIWKVTNKLGKKTSSVGFLEAKEECISKKEWSIETNVAKGEWGWELGGILDLPKWRALGILRSSVKWE